MRCRSTCPVSPLLFIWPGTERRLVFSHRGPSPPEAGLVTVGRSWTGGRRDVGVGGTRLSACVVGAARPRELADASLWYRMSVHFFVPPCPPQTPLTGRSIRLLCRAGPAGDRETALHPRSGGRLRFHCQPCDRRAHGGLADSCSPILPAPTRTLPLLSFRLVCGGRAPSSRLGVKAMWTWACR
jgi:hypothetical protein